MLKNNILGDVLICVDALIKVFQMFTFDLKLSTISVEYDSMTYNRIFLISVSQQQCEK